LRISGYCTRNHLEKPVGLIVRYGIARTQALVEIAILALVLKTKGYFYSQRYNGY
jgi:hypothetical protein